MLARERAGGVALHPLLYPFLYLQRYGLFPKKTSKFMYLTFNKTAENQ